MKTNNFHATSHHMECLYTEFSNLYTEFELSIWNVCSLSVMPAYEIFLGGKQNTAT